MQPTPPVLLVLISCAVDAAEPLAAAIVEARLAACVNLLPRVRSVYRWQGEVTRDDETLLLVKTAEDRFDELKRFVLQRHPYELPEIVAVKLGPAHTPYLEWVLDNSH